MHYASSSSMTVALVATAALFASQAEGAPLPSSPLLARLLHALTSLSRSPTTALPTSRSTSTVARRAHIASHHTHNVARAAPAADDSATALGDHSIVVDASTSSAGGQGGIKNSTINLTSISKRKADREGTFSSFSRVVRSLFGRAVPAAPAVFKALPLTYSPPVSSGVASSSAHKKRRSHKKRRTVKKPRANAPLKGNTRTLPSGLVIELGAQHTHEHITNVKRKRAQAQAAAQMPHDRRATNYTLVEAQASAYSAAVAALGDSEPTATPVVDAQAAIPTSFVNFTAPLPAVNLNDIEGAVPVPAAEQLSPVTLTITLVPSGLNGALVDAAHLRPTPTASSSFVAAASPSASASASSSSVPNPKASASVAALAALSASRARDASPDPASTAALAAISAYTPPAASASAAPAASVASAARMERRVVARAPGARAQARRRAAVAQVAQPVVKYYPAPA